MMDYIATHIGRIQYLMVEEGSRQQLVNYDRVPVGHGLHHVTTCTPQDNTMIQFKRSLAE